MVGRLWKIGTSFYCPSFPSPFYLYFTIFLLFFCGWRLLHLDTFAIVAWEYFFIRCYSCSICFCVPPLFGPSFVDFYSRYSPIFLYFFYAFSVLVLHFLFMVSAAKYFSIRRITKVPSVATAPPKTTSPCLYPATRTLKQGVSLHSGGQAAGKPVWLIEVLPHMATSCNVVWLALKLTDRNWFF